MHIIHVPGIPICTNFCCCLLYKLNPLDLPWVLDKLLSSLLGEKSRRTLLERVGDSEELPGEKSLIFLRLSSGDDNGGLLLGIPFMASGVAL